MQKTGTIVKTALTLMVCGMLAAPITADAGRFRGTGGGGGNGQGLGFVDADGDGINDNRGNGNGQGAGFVDADGDGINDNALRAGFVDADNDGLNDNFVDENNDGNCDISGLPPGTGDGTGYRGGR